MSKRIFISTSKYSEYDVRPLEKLKNEGYEVTLNPYKRRLTKEEALKHYMEYDGLIAGLEILDRDVIMNSTLKVISRSGTGMSNVDVKAAEEKGILVANTPDAPTNAVAEVTLGAILSSLRQLCIMDKELHVGGWNKVIGTELTGKTVLIVGFGRIGRRLAEFLKPFNVRILVSDPAVPPGSSDDFTAMELHSALASADIVTLHCSGDSCIMGEKEFSVLKKGAYIFNAARGGLIDETALCNALDQGIVRGGWLDTFLEEPYSGVLLKYSQIMLSPHIGSNTLECRSVMEMQAAENLINLFKQL